MHFSLSLTKPSSLVGWAVHYSSVGNLWRNFSSSVVSPRRFVSVHSFVSESSKLCVRALDTVNGDLSNAQAECDMSHENFHFVCAIKLSSSTDLAVRIVNDQEKSLINFSLHSSDFVERYFCSFGFLDVHC